MSEGERHGKFADDTHRFQISFRGSVPGDLALWHALRQRAARDGKTAADVTREALRRYLRRA